MTSTFKKHADKIAAGTIDKAFVRGVSRGLNTMWRKAHGYSVSSTAAKFDGVTLLNLVSERHPRVSAELTAQGLEWLRSRVVQKQLGERERKIVAGFDHYELTGFYDYRSNGFHLPLWRVHDGHGNTFTYFTGSWQSGIPLTVTA